MKKTVTLLTAFLLLGVVLAGFSCLHTSMVEHKAIEQDALDKSYEENNTFHYSTNEYFQIDSEKDEEGEDYGWVAGVDWKGTMGITVENVRSVHSLDSKILDKKYLASDDIKRQRKRLGSGEDSTLILYDITLDASKLTSKSLSKQHNGEDFMTENDYFASTEPLYLKGFNYGTSSYNGTNGYMYKIEKDRSTTLTIGYLANREVEKKGFTICLGTAGWEKYLIDIAPSDIEVIE